MYLHQAAPSGRKFNQFAADRKQQNVILLTAILPRGVRRDEIKAGFYRLRCTSSFLATAANQSHVSFPPFRQIIQDSVSVYFPAKPDRTWPGRIGWFIKSHTLVSLCKISVGETSRLRLQFRSSGQIQRRL